MITILKLFGRGQITLPKKWRERFDTNMYIAKETSQGLLVVPFTEDAIKVDEKDLKKESSGDISNSLFKKKFIKGL